MTKAERGKAVEMSQIQGLHTGICKVHVQEFLVPTANPAQF